MNLIYVLLMAPPAEGEKSNPFMSLLPFVLIFVIIYFFMIRPQSKKAKEQKQFKAQIKKGDKIVTIGGVHGKIAEIKDNTILLEISPNNRITIDKGAVSPESTKASYSDQSS